MSEETLPDGTMWAVVEVMGHSIYAGLVSQQEFGGVTMVRVDSPEVEGRPAFTKLLSGGAIFCITPVEEEIARRVAGRATPLPWNITRPQLVERIDDSDDDQYESDYPNPFKVGEEGYDAD